MKLPTIVLKFTIFLPSPAVCEWHKLERWQGGEVWEIGLKLRRWQGFLTTLSFLHTTPILLTWQPHQFNFYFVVLDRHILARCITYLSQDFSFALFWAGAVECFCWQHFLLTLALQNLIFPSFYETDIKWQGGKVPRHFLATLSILPPRFTSSPRHLTI